MSKKMTFDYKIKSKSIQMYLLYGYDAIPTSSRCGCG